MLRDNLTDAELEEQHEKMTGSTETVVNVPIFMEDMDTLLDHSQETRKSVELIIADIVEDWAKKR